MFYILVTFYVVMAAAGYLVEFVFGALGIIPISRAVGVVTQAPSWDYTSILNIVALIVSAALVVRFVRTGGSAMLRMMSRPESEAAHDGHERASVPID
jgi:hypothetical protein